MQLPTGSILRLSGRQDQTIANEGTARDVSIALLQSPVRYDSDSFTWSATIDCGRTDRCTVSEWTTMTARWTSRRHKMMCADRPPPCCFSLASCCCMPKISRHDLRAIVTAREQVNYLKGGPGGGGASSQSNLRKYLRRVKFKKRLHYILYLVLSVLTVRGRPHQHGRPGRDNATCTDRTRYGTGVASAHTIILSIIRSTQYILALWI
jgi:hypothetical protein